MFFKVNLRMLKDTNSSYGSQTCSQGRTRTEYRSRRIRQPYDSIEPIWDYWSWGLGHHPSLRPPDYVTGNHSSLHNVVIPQSRIGLDCLSLSITTTIHLLLDARHFTITRVYDL